MDRKIIFEKYKGHCAYCGNPIDFNKFEVDHIEPLRRNDNYGGSDTIENKNPACMPCNRSKSTFTIEGWRTQLHNKIVSLNRDSATYRVAKRFGLVKETGIKIEFHFEQLTKK